jgi:TonB family protein
VGPMVVMIAMQAATPAGALAPSSQWLVDPVNRACELVRTFGPDPATTLMMRSMPTDTGSQVRLVGPRLPERIKKATLRNEATGAETTVSAAASPGPDGMRVLDMNRVDNRFLAGLKAGGAITVMDGGDKVATLELRSFDAAWGALDQCNADLLKQWGVDPAAIAQLKALPEPTGRANEWVQWKDFPPAAFGKQGASTIRYVVGQDGRVHDCAIAESSGTPLLDETSCKLFAQRARYKPAVGANGAPTEATIVQTVSWTFAGPPGPPR